MPNSPLLDLETLAQLREFCEDDGLIQLIETFLGDMPTRLQLMHDQLDAGNCGEFTRTAHSIRSGIGSLGALRMAPLARQLEECATAGQLAELPPLLEQLELAYSETRSALLRIAANPACLDDPTAADAGDPPQ